MFDKILRSVTDKYGKGLARSIFSNYGDDVAKKGGKSFIAREMAGTNDVPKMLSYHGIYEDKLMNALKQTDEYLVNPSIQTVNPALNMGGDFGEIIMLANKDLVNSAKPAVNTFNRDIYSPRFPSVTEDGLIEGTKKFASADNLSNYMNKTALKGGEYTINRVNSGALAGRQAKKFKNVRDMVENQGNIGEYGEVRNELNKYSDDLRDLLGDMSETISKEGSHYGFSEAEADMLDMIRGKAPFYDYGDDIMNRYSLLMDRTKKLPTDYFETKVTRPVKMNEFSGAVLPEGFDNPAIMSAFERNNIPVMGRYNPNAHINDMQQNESLQSLLTELAKGDRFKTPYLMGGAGVLGGGSILSGLMGGGSERDVTI